MCLTLFEDDCSVDPDVDGAVFDSPRSLGFFTCAPPRKSSSAVRVSIGGVSITQWAVGWIDITRRNMSTGARAMATTLEADGRPENGRWRYGAVVAEITDSGKSTWRNLLNQYRRIACAARPGGVPLTAPRWKGRRVCGSPIAAANRSARAARPDVTGTRRPV